MKESNWLRPDKKLKPKRREKREERREKREERREKLLHKQFKKIIRI